MVIAWDLRSDNPQPVFTNAVNKPLSVACSSKLLAVGDWFGRVQVWNWTSWKQMADFQAHPMFTLGMAFSPSGEVLATGGPDQLIRLWDTRTFQSRGSLRGHEHEVESVRFSPDGRWILTAGKDETVRLWPAQPLPRQLSLPGAWMPLWFSQDSREMLAINFDKGIDRWSLPSGQHLGRLRLAEEPPGVPSPERMWAISADGQRLALSEADHELRLWVSGGAKLLHRIQPASSVLWTRLSPSGRFVAAGTDQSCIQVWDFESGREVATLREAGPVFAFAANDRLLAFHRPPYRVAVYDLEAGRILATLPPHHWFVNELAFTPDNRTLISASADGSVRFWDVRSWRLRDVLRGDLGGRVSLILSPDARTVAIWSADQTLRLWHYETLKEVLSFNTPEAWLVFSPDGTWLAAGGGYYDHHPGAGMQLWYAPPLDKTEHP
jgi:WD40 repeat protein